MTETRMPTMYIPHGGGPCFFMDWTMGPADTWSTTGRAQKLAEWADAPSARYAHPREEHLIPLMVVAGAGENDSAVRVFNDKVFDSFISGYRFG